MCYPLFYFICLESIDMKYLFKEIEALKRLDHYNIIKMITYGILDDEKIVILLEFGEGGTLKGKVYFILIYMTNLLITLFRLYSFED